MFDCGILVKALFGQIPFGCDHDVTVSSRLAAANFQAGIVASAPPGDLVHWLLRFGVERDNARVTPHRIIFGRKLYKVWHQAFAAFRGRIAD